MFAQLDSIFGLKRHHLRIESGIDTVPLLVEFKSKRDSLKRIPGDTTFRESNLYPVRHLVRDEKNKNYYYGNITQSYPTENYERLPLLTSWAEEFAKRHKGSLSWIFISIIEPKGRVYAHSDAGLYFGPRDRYHLILQSTGSGMYSGGQTAIYDEGEVWLFNNKVPHTAFNESTEERVHVLIDILPNNPFVRIKNILWWIYWGLRPRRLWRYYFGKSFPHL